MLEGLKCLLRWFPEDLGRSEWCVFVSGWCFPRIPVLCDADNNFLMGTELLGDNDVCGQGAARLGRGARGC